MKRSKDWNGRAVFWDLPWSSRNLGLGIPSSSYEVYFLCLTDNWASEKSCVGHGHCVALQLLTDLLVPGIKHVHGSRGVTTGFLRRQRLCSALQHKVWEFRHWIVIHPSYYVFLIIFDCLWVKCNPVYFHICRGRSVLQNLPDWFRRGERTRPIASWGSPLLDTNLYAILLKICSGPTPGNREWWVP